VGEKSAVLLTLFILLPLYSSNGKVIHRADTAILFTQRKNENILLTKNHHYLQIF
jgi:hypothetical protein